ncbi:MAG: DUF4157 domain-containing protein [Oscillospiraceae bacterium]
MKTKKTQGQENQYSSAAYDQERSEQEADRVSSRFKNSSDVKGEMSSQLGIDFSGVRVHQDAHAAQQTREMGATAFTRGNDVFMGSADALSRTGTTQSQVLAHELTHTVQQGAATQSGGEIAQTAPTGAVQMWNGRVRNFFKRHFGHNKDRNSIDGWDYDQDVGDARGGSSTPAAQPHFSAGINNASYLEVMRRQMRGH